MINQEHVYNHRQDTPIDYPAKTIVSLVPSVTESLFDLQLHDRLIGRTKYCIYPVKQVEQVEVVGGTKDANVDRIIELSPELVIANYEENSSRDIEKLREAGIPVWVTFPKTVQDVFNLLWNIMYLFDQTDMATRVRMIEKSYDWVNGIALQDEETAPKVFVPIWTDPWMTFNADTYMHDLIRVCGGQNIFADRERRFPLNADLGKAEPYSDDDPRVQGQDKRYPRITLAEVESHQPDIILLPSEPFQFTQEHIEMFAGLDIPAGKNKRVHLVDGSYLSWHGTRVAYALNEIPELISPTG
jgi:ABC-type Fe3+-hydroxamate transport system substrate-binding protein